jgi:acetyl esterase/lipase
LINYSEKYLNLTFDKIIVTGDSAGATLAMSVVSLALKKGCRVPDGLHMMYPALNCSRKFFTPSALLSVDDPILGSSFLKLVNEYYVEGVEGLDEELDYFLSPR